MTNSARFIRAHEATRAVCAEYECDYRATFAEALRETYRAEDDAATQWARMTGDEQAEALARMVWSTKRKDCGTDRRGEDKPPVTGWIVTKDDARTCAAEAWLKVGRLLAKHPDLPLALVLSRAVYAAARKIDTDLFRICNGTGRDYVREAYKRGGEEVALKGSITTDSPEQYRADRAADPYSMSATIDALDRACKDNIDRLIVRARADGYTDAEIGEKVGMSQAAIYKRRSKLYDRYLASDPETVAMDCAVIAYRIRKRLQA